MPTERKLAAILSADVVGYSPADGGGRGSLSRPSQTLLRRAAPVPQFEHSLRKLTPPALSVPMLVSSGVIPPA